MARSLSVDVNLNRRTYPYSRLSRAIRNAHYQVGESDDWQRVLLGTHRRMLPGSLERKLADTSSIYTESAYQKILPKLVETAHEVFEINQNFDKHDILRSFADHTLSVLVKGEVADIHKVEEVMKVVPN